MRRPSPTRYSRSNSAERSSSCRDSSLGPRSSTVTDGPRLRIAYAASSPSRPPPATITWCAWWRWANARIANASDARRSTNAPRNAKAVDRRRERVAAPRQDQPVVRELLAGAECHVAPLQIELLGGGVEPAGDTVVVVPRLRQKLEPDHRRPTVHQARDPHPVVQRVWLIGDHVDLALGVAPKDVVGGGNASKGLSFSGLG